MQALPDQWAILFAVIEFLRKLVYNLYANLKILQALQMLPGVCFTTTMYALSKICHLNEILFRT